MVADSACVCAAGASMLCAGPPLRRYIHSSRAAFGRRRSNLFNHLPSRYTTRRSVASTGLTGRIRQRGCLCAPNARMPGRQICVEDRRACCVRRLCYGSGHRPPDPPRTRSGVGFPWRSSLARHTQPRGWGRWIVLNCTSINTTAPQPPRPTPASRERDNCDSDVATRCSSTLAVVLTTAAQTGTWTITASGNEVTLTENEPPPANTVTLRHGP
jgi:hypothetical protein